MGANIIHADDGLGHPGIQRCEMMAIDGVRTLNRITWKDGRITVTTQGGGGGYHRTQAEWDACLAAHEFIFEEG